MGVWLLEREWVIIETVCTLPTLVYFQTFQQHCPPPITSPAATLREKKSQEETTFNFKD